VQRRYNALHTLTGAPAVVDASRHPRLRRWDSASEMPVVDTGHQHGFIPLEDGVEVKFSMVRSETGDYWQIPARTATADVEWPFAAPQPVRGVPATHYARLAFLRFERRRHPAQPRRMRRRIFNAAHPDSAGAAREGHQLAQRLTPS
jgi:hypothetical protein